MKKARKSRAKKVLQRTPSDDLAAIARSLLKNRRWKKTATKLADFDQKLFESFSKSAVEVVSGILNKKKGKDNEGAGKYTVAMVTVAQWNVLEKELNASVVRREKITHSDLGIRVSISDIVSQPSPAPLVARVDAMRKWSERHAQLIDLRLQKIPSQQTHAISKKQWEN